MRLLIPILASVVLVSTAHAQDFTRYNHPTRRAIVANVCPSVKITDFKFGNTSADRSDRFSETYAWSNVGDKDVIAFEFVTLKYDPFNAPLIGSRVIYPGHNSANYAPLKPTEKDEDGSSSYGSEETYTAIVYVRSVRFADGTVWTASPADVLKSIKTQVPDILDPGPLAPEKKKDKPQGS